MIRIFFILCFWISFISKIHADDFKGSSNTPPERYFAQHDLCESEIVKAERKHGIPHRLLMAIGTVESGRELNKKKGKRPWPWTVCANGKG